MLKDILKLGRQKLWTIHREQIRDEHKLTYLFWECTMNCNFFCKHCGSSAGRKHFSNELTTEEIKKAFREIAEDYDAKQITVAITGGEPLMRKDIFDVMGYASSLGFPWGMVTNGFMVNEEIVEKMKEAGMKTIDVSIDGIGKVHDDFRSTENAYKHAINAVKLLKKADFLNPLRISSSISKKNIHQLEEMYEAFKALGISAWRLINVDPIGRAGESDDLLLSHDELEYLLRFIKEKRAKREIDVTFGCSMYLGPEFEDEVRGYFFYCSTGINIGTILQNGDIYVCPNVPRRPEHIQGNIKNDRFSKVWENGFKFFRDKNRLHCGKCAKCEHWDECLGGSMHLWNFDKKEQKRCFMTE